MSDVAAPAIRCWLEDGTLHWSGELVRDNVVAWERQLAALPALPRPLRLDLSAFELGDGAAVVAAVNRVRQWALEQPLQLYAAPQVLGHNLYRVGALGAGSRIQLIATREDEPYG